MNTLYSIEKRDWGQHSRDKYGYPTGAQGWSSWYVQIPGFDDPQQVTGVCATLNSCAEYCTRETNGRRRSEFRVAPAK